MAPQPQPPRSQRFQPYVDREEPAGPPAPAVAPPVAPFSTARSQLHHLLEPPPARYDHRQAQTLKEIEPLDASAVFALLHPDGPGYAVVDGVSGEDTRGRAEAARRRLPEHN